jgi:poly(3-hydroxybutyrate) depolymerase
MAMKGRTLVGLLAASSVVGCAGSSSTSGNPEGQGGPGTSSSGGGTSSSGSSGGGSSSGAPSSSGSQGTSSSSGSSSGSSGSGSGGNHGGSSSSGGGSGSGSGSSGSGGSSGTVTTTGAGPTLPAASGTCPSLVGLSGTTVTADSQTVYIWSGTKGSTPAPILFYWHGTGSTPQEVEAFMSTQLSQITSEGGLVASFDTSTAQGTDTGDAVWYTGDFAIADQILACAVQQLNIDTRHIITAGCSAGGLQAGAMVFSRSDYLACSMPNSGGEVIAGEYPLENAHVPSLITTHGGSTDDVVISFATASATLDTDVASHMASSMPPGGYVVDCNHGGGHCGAPANDIAAQWQFCEDHPFGVSPDPYASGLPSSFPSYCTVIK